MKTVRRRRKTTTATIIPIIVVFGSAEELGGSASLGAFGEIIGTICCGGSVSKVVV